MGCCNFVWQRTRGAGGIQEQCIQRLPRGYKRQNTRVSVRSLAGTDGRCQWMNLWGSLGVGGLFRAQQSQSNPVMRSGPSLRWPHLRASQRWTVQLSGGSRGGEPRCVLVSSEAELAGSTWKSKRTGGWGG